MNASIIINSENHTSNSCGRFDSVAIIYIRVYAIHSCAIAMCQCVIEIDSDSGMIKLLAMY